MASSYSNQNSKKMSLLQPESSCDILVNDLNENFVCHICNGYLIRPVAVTECLHYFCRSCIVNHLETTSENKCPYCDNLIHETNPWDLLREDKTLEYIILKLVPGLASNERQRRKEFYDERGIPDPDQLEGDSNLNLCINDPDSKVDKKDEEKEVPNEKPKPTMKSLGNNQIGFHLRYVKPELDVKEDEFCQLEKPFIRSSSHLTIAHVKKFLQLQLKYTDKTDVDILCNGELMGRHHTLEFIYMTRWRYKEGVLTLDYRPKIELS